MSKATTRTLQHLREHGFPAEVVEKWIPQARRRKDLFDIIDIVCLNPPYTLGVQSTTYSNISSHVKKIRESPVLKMLYDCKWRIIVYGWRKKNGRWIARRVEVLPNGETCELQPGYMVPFPI